jgi:hypothetical protein
VAGAPFPLKQHEELSRGGPVGSFSPTSAADTFDASYGFRRSVDSFGRSGPASADNVDAVGHVEGPDESNLSVSVQGQGFGEAGGNDGGDHAQNGHSIDSAPMPVPATLAHQDDENAVRCNMGDYTAAQHGEGSGGAHRGRGLSRAGGGNTCEISLAEEETFGREAWVSRDGPSGQSSPERPVSLSGADLSPAGWSVEGAQEKRVSFVDHEADVREGADSNVWETDYGVKLTNEDITKLECVCKIASLGLARGLDSLSSDFDASGLGKASFSSVIFVADESTIASSRFAQVFCIVSGICVMWGFGRTPARQEGAGRGLSATKPSYTHFRYVV